MKPLMEKLRQLGNVEKETVVFLAAALVCAAGAAAFISFYFDAYKQPYMKGEIINLSSGWAYETERTGLTEFTSVLAAGAIIRLKSKQVPYDVVFQPPSNASCSKA